MCARSLALAALAATVLAACQSSPPPAPPVKVGEGPRAQGFDPRRAWVHVEALAAIGPRSMGSEGAVRARAYLTQQLQELDLEVVEQRVQIAMPEDEPFDVVNVAGRIPGESDDAIVIAAAYDTRAVGSFEYLGVNEAASGPAVILEMARVLAENPLPYTTWIVFLDGEAPLSSDLPPAHYGARSLGMRLSQEGVLDQIRLALLIGSACDPELRIARDLLSRRIYREEFWRAAARLGHTDAFAAADYESTDASHVALSDLGLRRVVALVDTSFGGDEPPGVYAGTADDDLEHCSVDSLEIVGSVSLEGLATISKRLAKIDRFAESPVSEAQSLAWDTLDASSRSELPGSQPEQAEEPGAASLPGAPDDGEGPTAEAPQGGAPEAADQPKEAATAEASESGASQVEPETSPAPAPSEKPE